MEDVILKDPKWDNMMTSLMKDQVKEIGKWCVPCSYGDENQRGFLLTVTVWYIVPTCIYNICILYIVCTYYIYYV